MELHTEKIREISQAAREELGTNANPQMVKKVVQEVVRRLQQEDAGKIVS